MSEISPHNYHIIKAFDFYFDFHFYFYFHFILPEWRDDGSMPVHGDGRQSEHADVDGERLHEGAERTHEEREQPTLQQRRLELLE